MEDFIVYEHVLDKKPPLVSPNSSPSHRNSSRKIRTETGKIRNLKNEAER
jgi:hypothetical protein